MGNPVEYAETKLSVHEICTATVQARDDLNSVLTVLCDKRDAKRKAEQDLEDREMEVAIDERGKHADLSATAMKEHLKIALFKDDTWRKLRDDVRQLTDDIDGYEADRKIKEREIEIGCARMIELGGYFNYLAAAKNASLVTRG